MKRIVLLLAILVVAGCSHKAPLIGISGSYMPSGGTSLNTNYSQAVSKAGGVPVIIPTVSSREEADAVLAMLDGIVFSGGEDLGPWLYGEEIYNETVFVDSVRDVSDVFLGEFTPTTFIMVVISDRAIEPALTRANIEMARHHFAKLDILQGKETE